MGPFHPCKRNIMDLKWFGSKQYTYKQYNWTTQEVPKNLRIARRLGDLL